MSLAEPAGVTTAGAGDAPPPPLFSVVIPVYNRAATLGITIRTVLAYYMAGDKPFTVARDLAAGLFQVGVPPKIIARQALRAYLPRGLYRRLVDTMVRAMGQASPERDQTFRG